MSTKIPERPLAIAAVLTAIVSVQLGATLSERLFPIVGVEGTTAMRQAFSALALILAFRPWRGLPQRQHWPLIAFYGALLGVMNFCFYLAIARLPLGIAVALEFIGPLGVAILSSRKAIDFVWVACAIAGLALLVPFNHLTTTGAGHIDLWGIVFALGAGLCWGAYIIVGQKISLRVDGAKAVALGMLVSSLMIVPVGIAHAGLALFVPSTLLWGALAAMVSSAIPYSCEMWALKRMPAKTFSLMMSLEPAVGALMGLAILGERLTLPQWLSVALVIAASAGSSLTARAAHDESAA